MYSHLSKKKPTTSELANLDTFDLAFMVLTGNVRIKSAVDVVLDALKANGDVVLWGPQAKLLSRVMRNGWSAVGGDDFMADIRAAFDTTGDIAVKSSAITKAFSQYANIGKEWWSDIKDRVTKVDAEIITRADRHYDRQRDEYVEKATPEEVADWYQSTMQDHVSYFARNFPQQTLHPEVERLVGLAQEKEGFRTIDRSILAERIDRIGAMPGRFIDGIADVEAGRAWQMTALQTAEAQNVTEYQIIAERDQVTCPVCEHIDGKVFSLQHGYRKMEQYFQLAPDQAEDIASLFPFPRINDVDNVSPEQVRNLDLVPPFHPRCRCEMVMLWTTPQLNLEMRFTVGMNDIPFQQRLVLRDQLIADWKDHKKTSKRDLYRIMGEDDPDRKVAMAYSGRHSRMLARYEWRDNTLRIDEFFKFGGIHDGGCIQTLAREAVAKGKYRDGMFVTKPADAEAKKFLKQLGFTENKLGKKGRYWHLDENGVKSLANAEAKSHRTAPGMKGHKVDWVQPSPMAPKPPSVKAGNYSEALLKYEKDIALRSREKALFFDDAGKLLYAKSGDTHHVHFDTGEIATWAKGKVITHNHPGKIQVPFSRADIRFLVKKEMKEIRAVTADYRYRAWVDWNATTARGEDAWKILEPRIIRYREKWRQYYYEEYYAGRIKDPAEISRLYRIATYKELSEKVSWFNFEVLDWPNVVVPTPAKGVPGGSKLLPKKYSANGILQRIAIDQSDIAYYEKLGKASANDTFKLELKDGGTGVYKPTKGERLMGMRRSIKNDSAKLADRECLTWEVDNHLGFKMVPETRYLKLPDGTEGSWQHFVPDADEGITKMMFRPSKEDRFKTSIIDFLCGNTDRHPGNYMIARADGKIHLIDNGYLYPDKASGGHIGPNPMTNKLAVNEVRTGFICGNGRLEGIESKISKALLDETIEKLETLDVNHLGSKWNLSRSAMDYMEERRNFMIWALKEKKWGEMWKNYVGMDPWGIDLPDSAKAFGV